MKRLAFKFIVSTSLLAVAGAITDGLRPGGVESVSSGSQTGIYDVEAVTTCTAAGRTGVERAPMLVALSNETAVLGLEDEATAGLPIPVERSGGMAVSGVVEIVTGEEFGGIRLEGLRAEAASGNLSLKYSFRVLDVKCEVAGIGRELGK
jgi:hypothetical protein